MANPYIPRELVHAWSDDMADAPQNHAAALQRLLKDQRRLTRFIEENAASMHPATAGICNYMVGVVTRIFDLAGGRLKSATWAQVREAEARIGAQVPELLPLGDGFVERARALSRAQPHILDEALMALFMTEVGEDEEEPEPTELLKVYLMMWIASEVLDANWRAPKDFEGPSEYAYVHIEPRSRDTDASED